MCIHKMLFHILLKYYYRRVINGNIFDNYLTKKIFKTVYTILFYLYTNKYAADSRWHT